MNSQDLKKQLQAEAANKRRNLDETEGRLQSLVEDRAAEGRKVSMDEFLSTMMHR